MFRNEHEVLTQVLLSLNQVDVESIDEDAKHATPNAQAFLDFCSTRIVREPHCFWSGRTAKLRAQAAKPEQYRSDAEVPFVATLFRTCMSLECVSPQQRRQISFAISRVYALYSEGPHALVYLSSDKPTESAGLTVGTNFWEAELPVLSRMVSVGRLTALQYFVYDQTLSRWTTREQVDTLPIYRRYAHPLDPLSVLGSFVEDRFGQNDYDMWRLTAPRRAIILGRVRSIVAIWTGKRHSRDVLSRQIMRQGKDNTSIVVV